MAPLIEDFTTYTEVDPKPGEVTVNSATKVSFATDLDEGGYLVRDFGSIDDFLLDFEFYFDNYSPLTATVNRHYYFIISDFLGNRSQIYADGGSSAIVFNLNIQNSTNDHRYIVFTRESGVNVDSAVYINAAKNWQDTLLYYRFVKSGRTVSLQVYSDSARTTLLEEIGPITLTSDIPLRYVYPVNSLDIAGSYSTYVSGYVQNLDVSKGQDLYAEFFVGGEGSFDLPAEFQVGQGSLDLFAKFEVGQDSKDLFAEFIVRNYGITDLFSNTVIRHTGTPLEIFAKVLITRPGSEDVFSKFIIRKSDTEDLHGFFHVGQDSRNLPAQFISRHFAEKDLFTDSIIRHSASTDLAAEFISAQDSADLKYRALINAFGYGVKADKILNYTQGYIFGTKFTTTNNLKVADSIEFFYRQGSLIQYARGAIYTVTGNYPGTLLEETTLIGPLSGYGAGGWVSLPFTDKPILQPNTEYFILVWANRAPAARARYTIPDATLKGFTKAMGSGPVGSFTSYDPMIGGSQRSWKFSLISTYDLATDASANLKAVFHVGYQYKELFAKFGVKQWQEDLAAEFSVNYGKRNLKAKFEVINKSTADLIAQFITIRSASTELYGKFVVRKYASKNLFHKMYLYQPFSDLFAKLNVVNASTKELYSKVEIRQLDTFDLAAEFIVTHSVEKDLIAEFTVRHSTTKELKGVFELQLWNELKATFYLPTRKNADAYYPIVTHNIDYWINYLQVSGKGFIDFPVPENDLVDFKVAPNSLKITADEVDKGYKEYTFGWLYEGVDLRYWQRPSCVEGKEFNLLVREDWKGYEEVTLDYTDIEKDNYVRVEYNESFGAGGIYYSDNNYGNLEYYGLSSFEGWLPGEIPRQRHRYYETPAIKWDLSKLAGLDLTRFAWARQEIYRYGRSGSIPGGPLKIYRMPDCQDIDVRGSPPVMGGCRSDILPYPNSSTGVYAGGIWTELTSNYRRMGFSQIDFSFNRRNGNNSFYANPSDGIGFSWVGDGADWDKIDLSTLMLGWLNGTYNNHGMFIRLYADPPFFIGEDYTYYNYLNGLRYYSRESSNANKPVIRVMLYPTKQKWSFQNNRKWDINTVDPYSGTACIRLKDWSKANYVTHRTGSAHGGRPGLILKDETPLEGYIDTAFRLNSETVKQVAMNWYSSPDDYWLYEEDTPLDNYINVYFRYQDASNHYRVEFNKKGTSCRIRRELSGVVTTLATFSGNFNATVWYKIRVAFSKTEDGDLRICVYKWNEYSNVWILLSSCLESTEYWPEGGQVRFESMDCDLDETDVWEVQ